jgi:hypothetical protein
MKDKASKISSSGPKNTGETEFEILTVPETIEFTRMVDSTTPRARPGPPAALSRGQIHHKYGKKIPN